jgi:glutathione peroxidase
MNAQVESIYDIPVTTIDGEETTLEPYRGKVLMIVNTASKCGFTGQYDTLQQIYEQFADEGFVVLGFPSNDFLGQEPGTEEQIKSFCRLNYGVTFPMFAKIHVKGRQQHPFYRYLTAGKAHPEHAGRITWNFNKFLVGRDGAVIDRFGSRTVPDDQEVINAIKSALEQAPSD